MTRLLLLTILVALSSCGKVKECNHCDCPPPVVFSDLWALRGVAEMQVDNTSPITSMARLKEFPQPVTGRVAEAVKFTVSNSNFTLPPVLESMQSYGKLEITDLYDNKLKVCGPAGNKRCTKAAIRILTRGGGKGFWNAADQYGAPITTGSSTIDLEPNFTLLGSINIPLTQMVVKLANFSSGPLSIPISIDFTDSPSGDYSTTIVVQYLLAE